MNVMILTHHLLLLLLLLCSFVVRTFGHPHYVLMLPHATDVFHDDQLIAAIGHRNPRGHGELNAFGRDFVLHGRQWTPELCQLDSDGDGRSNGMELGDPECTWKRGENVDDDDGMSAASFYKGVLTHPGIANVQWPAATTLERECVSEDGDCEIDEEEEEEEEEEGDWSSTGDAFDEE